MRCDYRLKNLSEHFCKELVAAKKDPFIEDIVVTQSRTMQLYLNKCLADTKQIAINIEYLHPQRSVNKIFKLADIAQVGDRLTKDSLLWQIYSLLPELEEKYEPIRSYIYHNTKSLSIRRYQLARVISGVFDNYMGYRGDWLERWQESKQVTTTFSGNNKLSLGEHEKWQADLWRQITVNAKEPIKFERPSSLLNQHIDKIKHLLPKKITVFGISNLPADFIDFFKILSEQINVDFYYLAPCLEYWGNVNRRSALLEKFDNPLLASWAILGRDFFNLLLDRFDDELGGDVITNNIHPGNILSAIQYDILHNTTIDESCLKLLSPVKIDEDDSLTINNCYSRMREVEVLHNHILNLLQTTDVEVSDIVVMAPNIEEYLPYIQAIFNKLDTENLVDKITPKERAKDSDAYIPFKIADCSMLETYFEAEILMQILNLADSKISAPDMFDIISSDPVSRKFNFSTEDLLTMHKLILGANIAWGKNVEQRTEDSGAPGDFNTWAFGFKRLLAGYAFDCEAIVDGKDGTLPLPLNSNEGLLLGKLINVCELIFKHIEIVKQEHSPQEWHEILIAIVNDFFLLPRFKNENLQPVYNAINLLLNSWSNAKLNIPLPLEVVKCALENEFSQNDSGGGFFRGSLTFCRLLPMRNIPFKAICLIGLNESEFPRQDRKCGFDLAHAEYRDGDRSLRKDDRYIFLETLMACQQKLYLSYIGQSNINNEFIPPSILISELLDYLIVTTGKEADHFITRHPLHGFNPEYFTPSSKLFSYSAINCRSAETLLQAREDKIAFCNKPLLLAAGDLEFSFEDFINFFISPAKFFLNYRLKINLYNANIESLRTCEPFELNVLEQYKLKEAFLEADILHKDLDLRDIYKASGDIPPASWGDMIIDEAEISAEKIAERMKDLGKKQQSKLKVLKFKLEDREITLSGEFDHLYKEGQAFYRPSGIKTKDKLKAWLWHQLALESKLKIGKTTLVGYKKESGKKQAHTEILNIFTEQSHLENLLEVFIDGLCHPLPLFLESSPEYIKARDEKKLNKDECLKAASAKWDKSYADYGYDLDNDANLICFGETPPPLNDDYCDEFIALADLIYACINNEVLN